jgi:hypothetical protein
MTDSGAAMADGHISDGQFAAFDAIDPVLVMIVWQQQVEPTPAISQDSPSSCDPGRVQKINSSPSCPQARSLDHSSLFQQRSHHHSASVHLCRGTVFTL